MVEQYTTLRYSLSYGRTVYHTLRYILSNVRTVYHTKIHPGQC